MGDELWGTAPYLLRSVTHQHFSLINLLSIDWFSDNYLLFAIGLIVSSLLGLAGIWPRLSAVLVFFFYSNLLRKEIMVAHGGDLLTMIMLIYLVFMDEKKRTANSRMEVLSNTLSNFAVYAARLQVAIVYITSCIFKHQGDLWTGGEALYYVLNIGEYSHPMARDIICSSDFLLYAANHFALYYQLAFPILVWFGKLRFPIICLGVLFHLFIAFGMGLMDFGFIAIACYCVFLPEETSQNIDVKFTELKLKMVRFSFRPA